MDLGLNGKKVLITGASRGLGKRVAETFVEEGASVFLVARGEECLKRTIDDLNQKINGNHYAVLDLMKENNLAELFERVDGCFGNLDIIVHNIGGTLGIKEPLSSPEDYANVWKFNLGISVEINNHFIPKMVDRKFGRIVHVSSSASVMADASIAYSSAKAALNIYVKGISHQFARFNVLVNTVLPGPFRSDGNHWDDVFNNYPERYENFINRRMSLKRLCDVRDISDLIVFTCSERTNSTVGSAISIDGGII